MDHRRNEHLQILAKNTYDYYVSLNTPDPSNWKQISDNHIFKYTASSPLDVSHLPIYMGHLRIPMATPSEILEIIKDRGTWDPWWRHGDTEFIDEGLAVKYFIMKGMSTPLVKYILFFV